MFRHCRTKHVFKTKKSFDSLLYSVAKSMGRLSFYLLSIISQTRSNLNIIRQASYYNPNKE